MSDIIFCRTRWEYAPYVDYFRLVELAGYPIIFVDEIDPASDNTYIFTPDNGETRGGWRQPRARIILHQLEWNVDGEHYTPPGVAETWSSDPGHAAQIDARFVCLGSDPRLNPEPDAAPGKIYDLVALQYLTHRRQLIRNQLLQSGVTFAPDGWGTERHHSLQRARAMFHVHQHEHVATIAPLRWALAAAYRLPVLSEDIAGDQSDLPCYIGAPYSRLAQWTIERLHPRHAATLGRWGAALHNDLCVERTFKRCIEAAL